jgi:protein phosphatase
LTALYEEADAMSHEAEHDTIDYVPDRQRPSRFFGPTPQPVRVEFGAVTHPGKVRPNNEDHYAVVRRHRTRTVLMTNMPAGTLPPTEEEAYVMVVADGIGGAAFGEVASMVALQTGWDLAERETSWILNVGDDEIHVVPERLDAYLQLINRRLSEQAHVDPTKAGMGTTLTAAYTVGAEAFIAHIGDSRAYLVRREAIYRLTRDHTLAQELVDAGMSKADTAKFGHVLTNFLGGQKHNVVTEARNIPLQHGDALLLSTDGLTDLVSDEQILKTVSHGGGPQEVCQALLDLALDRGGKDNVTVVLARYDIPGGKEEDPT